MSRFTQGFWNKASDTKKTYIIAMYVLYEHCIDKLGIIEDMIDNGEISKEIADKIESRLKSRGINNV